MKEEFDINFNLCISIEFIDSTFANQHVSILILLFIWFISSQSLKRNYWCPRQGAKCTAPKSRTKAKAVSSFSGSLKQGAQISSMAWRFGIKWGVWETSEEQSSKEIVVHMVLAFSYARRSKAQDSYLMISTKGLCGGPAFICCFAVILSARNLDKQAAVSHRVLGRDNSVKAFMINTNMSYHWQKSY